MTVEVIRTNVKEVKNVKETEEAKEVKEDKKLSCIDERRRQIIKKKVIAIGRISSIYNVLKDHPEVVLQLKELSATGKLPPGTLASGEEGILNALNFRTFVDCSTLREQKDHSSSFLVTPSPNLKVAGREV